MNPRDFQKSITLELDNLKNRVRNLIKDKHWQSDGEFKEAILKNVLNRSLPSNLSIGTGFIINSETKCLSTQIDLIIYENEYPPLFLEGDFVLLESDGVKGIIEVKTRLNNSEIVKALKKLNANVDCINGKSINSKLKFVGLFSYDYDKFNENEEVIDEKFKIQDKIYSESIIKILKESNGKVNHISLGKDLFIRHWDKNANIYNKPTSNSDYYNFYYLKNMGYSYFISNVYELCSTVDLYKRQWFSFPIDAKDGGKEEFRFRTCIINNNIPI